MGHLKKIIIKLDLSETCGPNCIPVVVLKKYESGLSYILAKLFKICLKKSYFPDCWKVPSVFPVVKNVRVRWMSKNHHLVSVFYVVSKVFEKLVNIRLIDRLVNNRHIDQFKKCDLFF